MTGPFDWTDDPAGAWQEAINAPLSPEEMRIAELTMQHYEPILTAIAKKPRCSHPKQAFRSDHWYCMECGKKMS